MLEALTKLLVLVIPSAILGLYVGIGLQGARVPFGRLVRYGTVAGLSLFGFRFLRPFGIHAVLQPLVLASLIRYLSHCTWSRAFVGAFVPMLLTAIGEGLIAGPFLYGVLHLTADQAIPNLWYAILGGWLSLSFLVFLSAYLYIRDRVRNKVEA